MRVAAIVLAAGAASRFGSPKALAPLDGRPLLEHVLDAVRTAGIEETIVVLGHDAQEIEDGIEWLTEQRVRNPDPRFLSGSLQIGLAAISELDPPPRAVVIVLGDQPRTRPDVIRALISAARQTDRPVVIPRYADGGGANPVLLQAAGFGIVDEATGDRGLGPILASDPDLVTEVPVAGTNPDIDRPSDLVELAWADRVRANREQVERIREVPDGTDFYSPVRSLFRADPDRTDDPVLEALKGFARPDQTWLDIGAGAGRYALPLARIVREVVAVEPSQSMVEAMVEDAKAAGIANIRPIAERWPMADPPSADVALIAHVSYDIEAIGPFLDAMERAADSLCIAVLMDRQPASLADPFWPVVHGEERAPLPALPEFVDLLRSRGREPQVTMTAPARRRFASQAELVGFLRRQLWIADGGAKEARFTEELGRRLVAGEDGQFGLIDQAPLAAGVVSWSPG